jgi:hypothetical protein
MALGIGALRRADDEAPSSKRYAISRAMAMGTIIRDVCYRPGVRPMVLLLRAPPHNACLGSPAAGKMMRNLVLSYSVLKSINRSRLASL